MIAYRQLTRADVPALLQLYPQLAEDGILPDIQTAEEIWGEIERRGIIYFGALDDGRVVSTCYLCLIPNLTHGGRPCGLIENVITDGAYRRRGIGREVIQMAVDYARQAGCYKAFLQSGVQRTDAHVFYKAIGFDGETKRAFHISFP